MRYNAPYIIREDGTVLITIGHMEGLDQYLRSLKSSLVGVEFSKPCKEGSENQNRAFHSLLAEWWSMGTHSAPEHVTTLPIFKEWVKATHAPPSCKTLLDEYTCYLKSWAKYNKEERIATITAVVASILQCGELSSKMDEILKGMEELFHGI